jgi:hypothetical protein
LNDVVRAQVGRGEVRAGKLIENLPAPLRDFAAEKFGELAELPAVLALPHRIARRGLRDAAGVAHFDQHLERSSERPRSEKREANMTGKSALLR